MEKERKQSSDFKIFDIRRRSISNELAISLIILVILFESILLAFLYTRQSRFMLRELEHRADDYANYLSEVLVVPIWDFDDEQIIKIANGFLQDDVTDEIHVMDSDGRTLFRSNGEKVAKNRIERTVNIVYKNQVIGRVNLYFSLDAYKKNLRWFRDVILLLMAGSLLVIYITTGLLLRVFMRKPLDILQKGIDRVSAGDYSYRFDEIRHMELSEIASRFSEMASEVQSRENALQRINRELLQEIAERKRAEEKITESEAKGRALIDALPDMMFQFDRNGVFLDYKGPEKDLYTAPEGFLEKNITDVLPTDISHRFIRNLEQVLNHRRIQVFEYEMPIEGKQAYFECRMVAVSNDVVMALVRNITENKQAAEEKHRLEEKLRNAQKMEAIGTLAGGVAHDLNNVLSGLVSYPELILMDLPEESPLRKPILTIQKSGERAANIVQDLLTLARRGVSVAEVVNLNHVINDYLKSPEYKKLKLNHPGVHMKVDLEPNLLHVLGSPVHLSKTVMNLVSNGVEAMPNEGSISITTRNRYIDRPIKGHEDIKEGDYVMIEVSDEGVGIPPEDIERIFEPFYTKKVMGRSGTGLGMAVVWGTVKDHNGYIDIQSVEGCGSTFIIYFPASREALSQKESHFSFEDYMGKGELVVIVDDVEEQREIASGILAKLGYTAVSVSSGEECIDYMKNNTADLLLLDMIMDPGIDGLETYGRILQLHPSQKAIIVSGFSESDRVKEAERLGAGAYIKKPYLIENIAVAVRAELDKPPIVDLTAE